VLRTYGKPRKGIDLGKFDLESFRISWIKMPKTLKLMVIF